jgi:Ca2+-binding RTX toxin-like protein
MAIVDDYRALLGGVYWNGNDTVNKAVVVTYSFPTVEPSYDLSSGAYNFHSFTAAEKDQARAALSEWAAFSGIVFVEATAGTGDMQFQIADYKTDTDLRPGPFRFGLAGDVVLYNYQVHDGVIPRADLMHAIGTALGLKGPTEKPYNDGRHDDVLSSDDPARTIMAQYYFLTPGGSPTELDKAAIAHIYGASGGAVYSGAASGTLADGIRWTYEASSNHLIQVGKGSADTMIGTSLIDYISGNGGNDRLFGGANNDHLTTGSGSDYLDGGSGGDVMTGGAGNDEYVVDEDDDVIVELPGGGIDTAHVLSTAHYVLPDNVENATGYRVYVRGNALDNIVEATAGGVLDGGVGADTMIGNGGPTSFYVDNPGDRVIAGPITDPNEHTPNTVYSTIDYRMPANIGRLELLGSADLSGYGNDANNMIVGNVGNNVIDGGRGVDYMYGEAGDDIYYVDEFNDLAYEQPGEGFDIVHSTVSYSLQYVTFNIEQLVLDGTATISGTGDYRNNILIGNSAGNKLSGQEGNDRIDGGGGSDAMYGGTGDDFYVVDQIGDHAFEYSGQGNDTVLSSIKFFLPDNVENLILAGGDDLYGYGNALANTLTGNGGNNVLDGKAGADTLAGGLGNDTYYVDNAGDQIVEQAGGNTDLVHATIDFALPDHVERLILDGSGDTTAVGNALDNFMIGNSGDNSFTGGAGADWFRLLPDFGQDIITDFTAGSAPGHDVVQFDRHVFGSYADIMAGAHQSGTDTVIGHGDDMLTLEHVLLSSLVAADFSFF